MVRTSFLIRVIMLIFVGPIIYLKVLGQPIIVLNNLKMAADILDRRARMTSDRPEFIVPRIMSGGLILPFISHNDM